MTDYIEGTGVILLAVFALGMFYQVMFAQPVETKKGTQTMRREDMRTPWLALTCTLYKEARGTTNKGTSDGDLRDVASVIWYDAGQDIDKLRDAALNPKRFSCWRDDDPQHDAGWPVDETPDYKALIRCQRIAAEMVSGGFRPTLPPPMNNDYMYHAHSIPKPDSPAWRRVVLVKEGVGHKFYG